MSLQLSRVTLYKNDLAFYERATTFPALDSNSFRATLDIPLESKNLTVETLSVRAPGLVVVNYDTELRDSIAENNQQEETFRFSSNTFADFLKSCAGAPIEFKKDELQKGNIIKNKKKSRQPNICNPLKASLLPLRIRLYLLARTVPPSLKNNW